MDTEPVVRACYGRLMLNEKAPLATRMTAATIFLDRATSGLRRKSTCKVLSSEQTLSDGNFDHVHHRVVLMRELMRVASWRTGYTKGTSRRSGGFDCHATF
jgi:hypothetical protein